MKRDHLSKDLNTRIQDPVFQKQGMYKETDAEMFEEQKERQCVTEA